MTRQLTEEQKAAKRARAANRRNLRKSADLIETRKEAMNEKDPKRQEAINRSVARMANELFAKLGKK